MVVGFWPGSREKAAPLLLKYPFSVEPGACMDVGEGKTSVNLDGGSFLESLFQMPLLQVNEPEPAWPRPAPAPAGA
jgi:hypothetical protein